MYQIFTIIVLFILVGCDGGFGIGGASWDSEKSVDEVNHYKSYISPRLNEETKYKESEGVTQHFGDILRTFEFNKQRVEENVELNEYDLLASFKNHRLVVKSKESTLITEELPSVFIMHPIRLGIGSLDGEKMQMVINKSRSTTGRYFVAIYTLDGEVLYRNVLTAAQVWDVNKTNNFIDIIGCRETRRITFNSPNKPEETNQKPEAAF
ncbi:MAG: hypothetical protein PHO65_04980 [Sulfurovum sp.]|nr:hypothetical protein [Sulfurovum sp.]